MTALLISLLLAPPPTAAQIEAARAYNADKGGISFLVMHEGKILAEEYRGYGAENRPTELASGTKSFCGVMALAAEEDGLLRLDERVSDTIQEWREDERRSITIRQLLQLVGGIPSGPSPLAGGRVPSYKEAIQTKANAAPGRRFQYGSTPFMIFGEVMRRKLAPKGEDVLGYLQRRVLKPIGVEHGFWRKDADGNPHMPSGASLTARNWAKFGEMIRLDGKGVLKPGQLKRLWEVTQANASYGLTWWLPANEGPRGNARLRHRWVKGLPRDVYMAAGAGGQRLYVVPSRGLVVVRQAPVRGDEPFMDSEFIRRLLGSG